MSVFASRDFTRLWVAGAASTLGSQLAFVALPLFAFALTGSAAFAGLLGFANALTRTLAGIPAGLVVDRCDRKSVMVWCDALRAVAISALVVLALAGRLEAWSLVLLIAVEGALSVLFAPAETAALRHVVPSAELPVAFARNESRSWAAALVGPPLGGLLFSLAPVLPFVGNAVAYVLSLLAIVGVRTDLSVPRRPAEPRPLAELGRGFRRLAADVFLRLTTVQVALHNVALGALSLIVILRAGQQGLPGVLIGVLVASQAMGALLGSLAAPRLLDRLAAGRIVLITGWSWCGLVPVIAFTGQLAVVLPCLMALWFLVPVQRSVIGLYQVRATPDAQVGRVSSAFAVVTTALSGLGLLLGGYLLESATPTVTAVVLGTITLAPVLVSSASRGMRRASVPLQPASR